MVNIDFHSAFAQGNYTVTSEGQVISCDHDHSSDYSISRELFNKYSDQFRSRGYDYSRFKRCKSESRGLHRVGHSYSFSMRYSDSCNYSVISLVGMQLSSSSFLVACQQGVYYSKSVIRDGQPILIKESYAPASHDDINARFINGQLCKLVTVEVRADMSSIQLVEASSSVMTGEVDF